MTPTRRDFAALTLSLPLALGAVAPVRAATRPALVIARGGGTGEIPEGTRGAYEMAIRDGADFIAATFMPSKDGALVALSGPDLSTATDVAARPQFADRRRDRAIDGAARLGWFVHDFTLAELKTLDRTAPSGGRRRRGAGGEAGHAILTIEEVLSIAQAGSVKTARVVGVHATMGHPAYFAGLDLAIEPRLAGAIRVAGYNARAAAMFVASDDPDALRTIGDLTRARRVMRLAGDHLAALTPDGLKALSSQVEAVAVDPTALLDLAAPKAPPPTPVAADAHAAGLAVQAWIPADFPAPPLRSGDARRLLGAVFAAGVDGVAGDLAGPLARARADALPDFRQ